ncbi:hypothetical protein EXIGLDRAFT_758418 [Exidia glandulosa HHB12029]|uniref:50S ribosomal protein L10 n=1 Tax=Exidia glandulosa HHB12029 TaxID=1314781 RepID=A0A165QV53_EXIGL|nr:hypothetical protein EXIGLDRAFT_758418 [Exidia glandulosa HHB12029]
MAISMDPPFIYPKKAVPRGFSERKTYLYNRYRRIIDASATGVPFLLLSHADFTANQMTKFRQEIAAAKPRGVKEPWVEDGVAPTLEVITSAIFGVALREHPIARELVGEPLAKSTQAKAGSFAVLKLPSLDPPRLSAVLRAIERFAVTYGPKVDDAAEAKKKAAAADDLSTPGRRPKRVRKRPGPKVSVLGAVIEGRVFEGDGLASVSKLPDIGQLRAQLVGLLSMPASQIVALLGEAGGARLARTLEGLKQSLEEDAGKAPTAP